MNLTITIDEQALTRTIRGEIEKALSGQFNSSDIAEIFRDLIHKAIAEWACEYDWAAEIKRLAPAITEQHTAEYLQRYIQRRLREEASKMRQNGQLELVLTAPAQKGE